MKTGYFVAVILACLNSAGCSLEAFCRPDSSSSFVIFAVFWVWFAGACLVWDRREARR
jgi:hypothetical protein